MASLKALGKEWIKRLGLVDWNISIEWMEADDKFAESQPDKGSLHGYCGSNYLSRCAKIRIAKRDQVTDSILPYDLEETIVHELLHCRFAHLWDLADTGESPAVSDLLHIEITLLARSFVAAKRNEER